MASLTKGSLPQNVSDTSACLTNANGTRYTRCKESGEVLWLGKCYRPAWLDAQLDISDARVEPVALAAMMKLLYSVP